jgi:hypothetical protein
VVSSLDRLVAVALDSTRAKAWDGGCDPTEVELDDSTESSANVRNAQLTASLLPDGEAASPSIWCERDEGLAMGGWLRPLDKTRWADWLLDASVTWESLPAEGEGMSEDTTELCDGRDALAVW